MLYPFELLNISIIFTNIEYNQNIMRFARVNFRRALHVHLGFDHRNFFSAIISSNNKEAGRQSVLIISDTLMYEISLLQTSDY